MTIDSLNYFFSVASGATFLDASEQFNISQSSISKSIKQLENELGVKLLDRSTRSAKLTPAGQVLYEDLIELEPAYKKMLSHMQSFSKNPVIRVAIPQIASYFNIKKLIELFNMQHPEANVSIVDINTQNPEEFISGLYNNKFDFSIMYKPMFKEENLKMITLQREDLVAIFPTTSKEENSRPAVEPSETIHLEELSDDTIIIEQNQAMENMINNLNATEPFRLKYVEAKSWLEVLRRVYNKEGATIAFKNSLDIFNPSLFTIANIDDVPNPLLVLAYSKSLHLSDTHNMLIKYLIENKSSI